MCQEVFEKKTFYQDIKEIIVHIQQAIENTIFGKISEFSKLIQESIEADWKWSIAVFWGVIRSL